MIKNKTNFFKLIFLIVVGVLILTSVYMFVINIPVAYAMELDGNEYDQVFLENIEVLAKDTYGTGVNIVAEKELLYDLNLKKFGYIYDFEVNNEKGYAIVINSTGEFEMPEIFFDAKNPFCIDNESARIYACNMTYLYYKDDNYYFANNDGLIDGERLDTLKDMAFYSGYDDFTYESETIYFTSKSEDSNALSKRHPHLIDYSNLTNTCVATAGANIIQYWDRDCTELIPNYTPGTTLASFFLYSGSSDTTDNLIVELYYDMEINSTGIGATVNQFKNGLAKYIKRNGGYTLMFSYCIASGKFDYNLAKQYINNGEPIILFLSTFNIVEIQNMENENIIHHSLSKKNHAMVAFGYKDITYTLTNGTARNEKFLSVATGVAGTSSGYFNINYNTNIDEALAIKIN